MFPLWATTIMSLLILLFAVGALSFAAAIWGLLAYRVLVTLRQPKRWLGTVLAVLVFGSFALMFGWAGYDLSSAIIDGLIRRFHGLP